jgi:hypothetical protein
MPRSVRADVDEFRRIVLPRRHEYGEAETDDRACAVGRELLRRHRTRAVQVHAEAKPQITHAVARDFLGLTCEHSRNPPVRERQHDSDVGVAAGQVEEAADRHRSGDDGAVAVLDRQRGIERHVALAEAADDVQDIEADRARGVRARHEILRLR